MYPRIRAALVVGRQRLRLFFTDGSEGVADLAPMLAGKGGLLEALADPKFFATVKVDREAGTVVWPNGVDLDPDVLFEAALGEVRHQTEHPSD